MRLRKGTKVTNRYRTGYSSWSLLLKEADLVINEINDFSLFFKGEEKIDYNIIPTNSESSKKRILSEVVKRIMSLEKPIFLELFLAGDDDDKNLILFYAVCKTYQLIPDFIIDTVVKKWQNMDYEVTSYDFKSFLYKLSDTQPDIISFTEKSLGNIAASTIKILSEVGILSGTSLQKKEFKPEILKQIAINGDSWLLEILLLNENERQEIIG